MTLTNRSKPIPVSTCFAGNGSRLPSFNRLYWMNTLFHISITCGWSVLTNVFPSIFFLSSSVRHINMYFGAGSAGPCITHFPEIIFFISKQDPVFSQSHFFHSLAASSSFGKPSFASPSKTVTYKRSFGIFINFSQQFPAPCNRFFFKIIAKTPVAQHFKHGVMIGIHTYFFQVVMFSAYPQTFLRIRNAFIRRFLFPRKIILELVHTCIGEHQCRIIFYHNRSRRNNLCPFDLKKSRNCCRI